LDKTLFLKILVNLEDFFIRQASLQSYEPEDERFRDILAAYIRLLYPVGNILPIGNNYQDFPFVVFRSYSLEEMRQKVFTDKYLLSSNELNVLNLILSKDSVFTP
jgi:hypothetical protein